MYAFLLQVEKPALDTSFSSLEVSRTIALCFEHCPVRWEATEPVTSCLFSCPPPGCGGGGCRGHFVFIGSGGLYSTEYIEYKRESQLPSLIWVGKVCYNITPLHFENTCDAVWLLLGAQKTVKTEFHCSFFLFSFCFLRAWRLVDDLCFVTHYQAQQNLQEWAQRRMEAGSCSSQVTSPTVGWSTGGSQGWLGGVVRMMGCLHQRKAPGFANSEGRLGMWLWQLASSCALWL